MTIVNYDWDEYEDIIVEEYDNAGTTVAEYTTEPDLFGNVISQRRNGVDSVYHYDGLGSTLTLTDANGNVTDTYAYSAFGEITGHTGTTVNPFQHVGQKQYYRDMETGEYDVRRRSLLTGVGRWFSVDQLNAIAYSPAYQYVNNHPTFFADPSGLQLLDPDWPISSGCFEYCMAAGGSVDFCDLFCSGKWPGKIARPEWPIRLGEEGDKETFPGEGERDDRKESCVCGHTIMANIMRPIGTLKNPRIPTPGRGDVECKIGEKRVVKYVAECMLNPKDADGLGCVPDICKRKTCFEYIEWECTNNKGRNNWIPVPDAKRQMFTKCKLAV